MEETGVTIHLKMSKIADAEDRRQFVEKVGSYTVLTTSLNYASKKSDFCLKSDGYRWRSCWMLINLYHLYLYCTGDLY